MFKALALAVASIAAGIIIWAVGALPSGDPRPVSPPLTGWMQNFTPAMSPGPAPQMPFAARDGSARTLADFRGKLVLVNFWATWCGPCVREMPSLLRLQKILGGADFILLALSQDLEGWSAIDPFVKLHGLGPLRIFLDRNGAFARGQGVKGLPTTILYGSDGRELGRLAGIAEWDSVEAVALMRHYIGAGAKR